MTRTPRILLIDDGELEPVAAMLDGLGVEHVRLRGGLVEVELAPPSDLLIATPRRAGAIRRGSPAGAAAGRPPSPAMPSAANSLPALKPNQPTHNNEAPITVSGGLLGCMGSLVKPRRGPRKIAATSAEKPLDMCTTSPPAKSNAPRLAPI